MVVEMHNDGRITQLEEVEVSRAMFEVYEGGVVSLLDSQPAPIFDLLKVLASRTGICGQSLSLSIFPSR